MPKTTDITNSATRRSTRARRTLKKSVVEDLDDEELAKRMPPGYNPSDDSEDEYVPPSRTRKRNIMTTPSSRKKKVSEDASDDSSDGEDRTPAKRRKGPASVVNLKTPQSNKKTTKRPSPSLSTPTRATTSSTPSSVKRTPVVKTTKTNSAPMTTETLSEKAGEVPIKNERIEVENCPMEGCSESLLLVSNKPYLKPPAYGHLAIHYHDLGVEHHNLPRQNDPEHKYQCPLKEKCRNARKMMYREMYSHMSVQHNQLENLIKNDNNPKFRNLVSILFPSEQEEEEQEKIPVRVKKETVPQQVYQPVVEEDEEDPDDPPPAPSQSPAPVRTPAPTMRTPVPVRSVPSVARKTPVPQKVSSSSSQGTVRPRVDRIMSCFICNGPGRSSKEGRNLNTNSGLSELKYHFAVCVYQEGGFIPYLHPRQGEGKTKLEGTGEEKIEEYGNKWRYRCPFDTCEKNAGKGKAIGYKEFSIHSGVVHHLLELWALEQSKQGRQGSEELYQLLVNSREAEGGVIEEIPELKVEELHTCLICQGEDKEGKFLSMDPDKIFQTRYHYASCFYETGVYFAKYPPEDPQEDGSPIDVLGRVNKYHCQQKGCSQKRKMGYKEFTIHNANDHGGLEEIMNEHEDEQFRNMIKRLKKK